ncbi:MAG: hypothetical protein NT072_08035, partial [Deltaproteobacteria bacterium]|nr:hypothetical protein [Deltaproteobacteria bacterium]
DERPVFIADLGVTAASLCGLTLNSTTVGRDLSRTENHALLIDKSISFHYARPCDGPHAG